MGRGETGGKAAGQAELATGHHAPDTGPGARACGPGTGRQVAEQKKGARFTALLHHIYAIDTLRAAFYSLKRDAAPGVDGETWDDYGEALEAHLADLSKSSAAGRVPAAPGTTGVRPQVRWAAATDWCHGD
jgi:hypothetical protein